MLNTVDFVFAIGSRVYDNKRLLYLIKKDPKLREYENNDLDYDFMKERDGGFFSEA